MQALIPGAEGEVDSTRAVMRRVRRFGKMPRFTLMDAEKRHFLAERWCFRGRVDGWIPLAYDGLLTVLLAGYIKHLERESFFEIM